MRYIRGLKNKKSVLFNILFNVLSMAVLMGFLACMPTSQFRVQDFVQQTQDSLACENFQEKLWMGIQRMVINGDILVDKEDIRAELKKQIQLGQATQLEKIETAYQEDLIEDFVNLYEFITRNSLDQLQARSRDEMLQELAGMELGDKTTSDKIQIQSELKAKFNRFSNKVRAYNITCDQPTPSPTASPPSETGTPPPTSSPPGPNPTATPSNGDGNTQIDPPSGKISLPVAGIRKSFSTLYQDCDANDIAPLDEKSPSVLGISVVGVHVNGVGKKRMVTDVLALDKTHYYIKLFSNKNNKECFNVQTNPLIYDYGGKPYTSAEVDSTLNFFKNAGTGTTSLGIDCSAFVFSSLAASGLKMSPDKTLKAINVHGVNAAMFKDPQANGLTCLDRITITPKESLRAGDVIASQGHVVIVDEIGADPFGLKEIKKASDCVSSKISSLQFDFVIAQSSPSKNGIGVNKYIASDYFSGSMKTGLEKYAIQACKAKFEGTTATGSAAGTNSTSSKLPIKPIYSEVSIVRHKQSPECLGEKINLEKQTCLSSCTNKALKQ